MKKKLAILCALVMLIVSYGQSVCAVNVILNSAFLKFPDQEPVVLDGFTLVPIRPIAEALGLEVGWDDPSDTVTLKKDNFYIEMVIGSTRARTSGGVKDMVVAPRIINSRTMVPLRFIAEEMGLTVLWNDEYQRVVINGKVDTETVPVVPMEEATEVATGDEEEVEKVIKDEEPIEEETEEIIEGTFVTIDTPSSSIMFEVPASFYAEDPDAEDRFAFRSLDAFDAQHTYNWEMVSRYESYEDEEGLNGIVFVVQELAPYEGEEYDISDMNQEMPEPPERPERPQFPEIDMEVFIEEFTQAIVVQLFIDAELEVPENVADMSEEDVMAALGIETEEELEERMTIAQENADFSLVTGYDEYLIYQEEQEIYREEYAIYQEDFRIYWEEASQIAAVKNYALRHFQTLYSKATDEDWIQLIGEGLNSDPEVRYEDIEIIDHDGKKIIHATIYAEDPDDEQGVYDYYEYQDGDFVITIFGGTLLGSEPSPDAVESLTNMEIK